MKRIKAACITQTCSIKMLCPGWGKLAKAAALISQNRHQ